MLFRALFRWQIEFEGFNEFRFPLLLYVVILLTFVYNNYTSPRRHSFDQKFTFTFTFIHLADAFIHSDLQLLYMSEVACLWSN